MLEFFVRIWKWFISLFVRETVPPVFDGGLSDGTPVSPGGVTSEFVERLLAAETKLKSWEQENARKRVRLAALMKELENPNLHPSAFKRIQERIEELEEEIKENTRG